MSVTPTANVDINDIPVFFEEPTVGGNPVSTPTLAALPVLDSFNETKAWDNDAPYVFGSEDIYDIVQSKKQNSLDTSYKLIATDFLRRGTELGFGSGSIDKTISIIQPLKLNNSPFYKRYRGVITDTVGIDLGNYYSISHSFVCKSISNYMTLDELKLDLGLATNATLTTAIGTRISSLPLFPPSPNARRSHQESGIRAPRPHRAGSRRSRSRSCPSLYEGASCLASQAHLLAPRLARPHRVGPARRL